MEKNQDQKKPEHELEKGRMEGEGGPPAGHGNREKKAKESRAKPPVDLEKSRMESEGGPPAGEAHPSQQEAAPSTEKN